MGHSCVRAVEPEFNELPPRLQMPHAPMKLYEEPGSVPGLARILRDGHEQSAFEAKLEAWALHTSRSVADTLALGGDYPIDLSGRAMAPGLPHQPPPALAAARARRAQEYDGTGLSCLSICCRDANSDFGGAVEIIQDPQVPNYGHGIPCRMIRGQAPLMRASL
mmetsp:Transcript_90443/g.292756  ORF Transcript_90443/g.292756 Transcript_90443/m.292756 type:complete len:164 (-) Transcript_90443:62-553(-)